MPTAEQILAEVQLLTHHLRRVLEVVALKPRQTYELPEHLPAACLVPRKVGTSLPEVVARAWERQVRLSGKDKNAILADALLAAFPPDTIEWAIDDMLEDARRMWALTGNVTLPARGEGDAGPEGGN